MTEDRDPPDDHSDDDPLGEAIPEPTKTPMYQAFHAARYQRQAFITEIQTHTGRRLICYVAGPGAALDRDDTLGFVDLLHNVIAGESLDLLLHTGGGDIDATEKIVKMLRSTVGEGDLRVIIPDYAKSAGTLLALAADQIVMGDSSELGPIDPQIPLSDDRGNVIQHSVLSYLDAYDELYEALQTKPDDIASQIMIRKLDPATVKLFRAVRDRSRILAEDHLKLGMFRKAGGNFTKIAADLIDTDQWLTHGQVIARQDAEQLGLNVDYLDPQSDAWQRYWQLYCLQRLAVRDGQKLFESDYASLCMEAAGGLIPRGRIASEPLYGATPEP